jgi:dsDNA-specific endonuclease/ATPase MutS2
VFVKRENSEQEEREEFKVLAALTATVANQAGLMYTSLDAATLLDLARARAKHAEYATVPCVCCRIVQP